MRFCDMCGRELEGNMRFCDRCGAPQTIAAQSTPRISIPPEVRSFFEHISHYPDVLSIGILFFVTALTIFPLFMGEFTRYWGSIEAAYISDSIFISRNFPNAGWYPFWYGGLPFHDSYPPLFIYAVSILHAISSLSIGRSYRIFVGLAYSVTPAAVYLLAKFLTKRSLPSFLAGLTYSFVPTFLPDPAPSHIRALTFYGEGPHFFGLVLELFALLQLFRYMRKPTWFTCVATSILIASVALTNLIAFFALTFLMVVAVATEIIYKNDSAVFAFLLSSLIAFGLITFQYDLEFIRSNMLESATTAGAIVYGLLALPALMVGVFLVRRYLSRYLTVRPDSKPWVFTSLWIALLGVILARVWFQLPQLAPQPVRYVTEFDVGISLLVGLILTKVDKASLNWRHIPWRDMPQPRKAWILAVLLVLLSVNIAFLLPLSLRETQSTPVLSEVPEYQIANWLSDHVTDERIFASGSVSFWLNVFSTVPQMRGGSDQGATNTYWADAAYQIQKGADPGVSVLWAQAWNVKYIVVTFRNASNYNLDYSFPHKFDNLLPLRYFLGGYGVYEVPLTHPAFVEAISAQSAESMSSIGNVFDIRNLAAYTYLTQVDSNSTATVTYMSPNPDILQVSVRGGTFDTAILVKATFDPRWTAELNGERVEISSIGPDFMVVYPRTDGNYQLTFTLQHSDGETIGIFGTVATIIVLLTISLNRLNARVRIRRQNTSSNGQKREMKGKQPT